MKLEIVCIYDAGSDLLDTIFKLTNLRKLMFIDYFEPPGDLYQPESIYSVRETNIVGSLINNGLAGIPYKQGIMVNKLTKLELLVLNLNFVLREKDYQKFVEKVYQRRQSLKGIAPRN